jgi:hypothetical protein
LGVEPEYQRQRDNTPNAEVLEAHEGRNVTLWSFFKTTSTGLKYRHTTGKLREDRHIKGQVPKCSHVGYRDRNLKRSASNLKTHLARTHGLSEADIRRGSLTWIDSKASMKKDNSIKTKIEIQMATSQTSKVKDEVHGLFARRDLPLSLIKDHGFQKLLLWASNTRLTSVTSEDKIANVPVKSRRTLQRLLDEAKSSFLNKLKEILLSDECVSLNVAFDGWTSCNNKSYISIIVSFVSRDFRHQSYLIGFQEMVGPHIGEDLAKQLIASLDMSDPSLKEKVISVTADGARVNTTTTSPMRDYIVEAFNQQNDGASGVDAGTMLFSYHWCGKPIWCILHQINLIIQKFIQEMTKKMTQLDPIICTEHKNPALTSTTPYLAGGFLTPVKPYRRSRI